MILRACRVLFAATFAFGLSACVHVPVYARSSLAHRTMSASSLDGPGESHMRAIQEGATGGAIGAEGGCGCN